MNTNRVTNSLEGFKLYYEEMEKKVAKAKSVKKPEIAKVRVPLKQRITSVIMTVRGRVSSIFHKNKKAKKQTKEDKKLAREQQKRGILGIGLLFVVVSIAYSSYVIYNGVSSTASRVMLVPQVVFALLTLIKAFSKIYK